MAASVIIFFKYFFFTLENTENTVGKALERHRSISIRYQWWVCLHTACELLTSRLMILSAVRWIRRDSVCICARSKCSKLRKHDGDRQSSPSPPYSWTSRDTHCRDSSHTSWFSLENCKKTKPANLYVTTNYMWTCFYFRRCGSPRQQSENRVTESVTARPNAISNVVGRYTVPQKIQINCYCWHRF